MFLVVSEVSSYDSQTKRANPLKGGDAKPPIYGIIPRIAGLPMIIASCLPTACIVRAITVGSVVFEAALGGLSLQREEERRNS